MPAIICKDCGYKNTELNFDVSQSPNHDFLCPKCGSINIDTSEINDDCESEGHIYEYGKDNRIRTYSLG